MPDVTAISTAWASMKAASEIASALFNAKVDAAAKDQILEMRGLIASSLDAVISAKEEVQAARDAERKATDKLLSYENWLEERKRYQLTSPSSGLVVYALKEAEANGEPPHYLCATCYQNAKKSILQGARGAQAFTSWYCPVCRTEVPTGYRGAAVAVFPS